MIRNEKLEDISDGRLYDANDMVKAYCNECKGCHACCTGMGNSIILDPMDVMRLCRETGKNFTQLLEKELEVNVVDGLVLPNIRMTANKCPFLNEEGRCSIHSARPGFADSFHLADITPMTDSDTYCRYTSVSARAGLRSRCRSG